MITYQQYWMGRDKVYPADFTLEIQRSAVELLRRVNELLDAAKLDGVMPAIDQATGCHVASGWRPAGVNARTQNSAEHSRHITAQAIDIQDDEQRNLARWCLRNLPMLEQLGLWTEDPQWTGGKDPWVHLQSVPPKSGRRVYIPSSLPPMAEKLPEQMAA